MDAILLLAKNHLRGEIPTILNTKDNQVFLDYLAGGQSRQVATERAANAQSTGILSMGARNVLGIPEQAGVGESVEREVSAAFIQDLSQTVESMAANMEKTKKDCLEYTILAKRCHDQAMGFEEDRVNFTYEAKKRLIDMKADAHERIVETEKRRIETELDAEKQKIDMKKLMIELTIQEADAIHKRAQAIQALADASAALKEAQLVQRTEYDYDNGLTTDSDDDVENNTEDDDEDDENEARAPGSSSRHAFHSHLLSLCKIPDTLDELKSLFDKGPSAALHEELISLCKAEYEAAMLVRLQTFSGATSKHAKVKFNDCMKRVQHYCHLVFWKLAERYLSEDARAEIMGSAFDIHHKTLFHGLAMTTWCNVDEKVFHLHVDDRNIPAAVDVDKKLLDAAQRWFASLKLFCVCVCM
jgi:hypothetical protein